ncbi:M23 family metallopeptidase [Oceaniglobus indicus]|uniref:M23 family metallopeptidase n=1 Tax=Oceaniglobus indicus TaxID=2047749 RepID=UPI001F4E44E3|nr:M23 family metallopeptidase [Oceaniglobus indicus]
MNPPLDCTLGKTCFIQQYTDTDPGPGSADYMCGPLSYDGHKGTDFALPSIAAMRAGVDVYPAAPGTVTGVRDGMEDVLQGQSGAPDVSDRECGNGVVIDHGGGWETQYCHMKRGSVRVRRGNKVNNATVIGQAGFSGLAAFPHLHLSVRKDGTVVDPFNPEGLAKCDGAPADTLWQTPPAYRPGGLIAAGFFPGVPDYETVRAGAAAPPTIAGDAGALVIWGFAFGGRAGDQLSLEFAGPDGSVLSETVDLDRNQAQFYRAVGRRAPDGGWPAGEYLGLVRMLRDGVEIDSRAADVRISED